MWPLHWKFIQPFDDVNSILIRCDSIQFDSIRFDSIKSLLNYIFLFSFLKRTTRILNITIRYAVFFTGSLTLTRMSVRALYWLNSKIQLNIVDCNNHAWVLMTSLVQNSKCNINCGFLANNYWLWLKIVLFVCWLLLHNYWKDSIERMFSVRSL